MDYRGYATRSQPAQSLMGVNMHDTFAIHISYKDNRDYSLNVEKVYPKVSITPMHEAKVRCHL